MTLLLLGKIFVAASYVAMLVMNVLANTLPLGGRTTGGVSAKYPNLFTPAGYTFSIWGVIYLVLGGAIIRYLLTEDTEFNASFQLVGFVFISSSLLNIAWLLAWHHDRILLSSIVMVALFSVLAWGFLRLPAEPTIIRAAISLYFGWVSVALIANVTITLIAIGFPRFGVFESFWLLGVLLLGLAVALLTLVTQKDVLFALVFLWAYIGILIRHLSTDGHALAYPHVIVFLAVSILALATATIFQWIGNAFRLFGR